MRVVCPGLRATAMDADERELADRRGNPRARLRLRLAVVYPQPEGRPSRPIYHGATHDICMSGMSMVAEDNAFHEGRVSVFLALPPAHSWAAQKVIRATVEMTYAIHSTKLNGYKIGMTFVEFQEDGEELLQAALERERCKADENQSQRASARWPLSNPILSQ